MTYRLISSKNYSDLSYCQILWGFLACIALYVIYSGILKKQNVRIGVVSTDSYENFANRIKN